MCDTNRKKKIAETTVKGPRCWTEQTDFTAAVINTRTKETMFQDQNV